MICVYIHIYIYIYIYIYVYVGGGVLELGVPFWASPSQGLVFGDLYWVPLVGETPYLDMALKPKP